MGLESDLENDDAPEMVTLSVAKEQSNTERIATEQRRATPGVSARDDSGAAADSVHGDGGDADRAGGAAADHPVEPAGALNNPDSAICSQSQRSR